MYNRLAQLQKERALKKKRIKDEWADSGEYDKTMDLLKEKRKPSISPDNLPF